MQKAPSDTGLEASATVGILYAGETAGTASNNQIVGFVIGVQVSEFSMPEILKNVIDGGTLSRCWSVVP